MKSAKTRLCHICSVISVWFIKILILSYGRTEIEILSFLNSFENVMFTKAKTKNQTAESAAQQ